MNDKNVVQLLTIDGAGINILLFRLVFFQCMQNRMEALAFEYQIKRWSRKKKEALIERNWTELSFLAKKRFNK